MSWELQIVKICAPSPENASTQGAVGGKVRVTLDRGSFVFKFVLHVGQGLHGSLDAGAIVERCKALLLLGVFPSAFEGK